MVDKEEMLKRIIKNIDDTKIEAELKEKALEPYTNFRRNLDKLHQNKFYDALKMYQKTEENLVSFNAVYDGMKKRVKDARLKVKDLREADEKSVFLGSIEGDALRIENRFRQIDSALEQFVKIRKQKDKYLEALNVAETQADQDNYIRTLISFSLSADQCITGLSTDVIRLIDKDFKSIDKSFEYTFSMAEHAKKTKIREAEAAALVAATPPVVPPVE